MNKRALIGKVIVVVVILLILTGTTIYLKFREGGFQFGIGKTEVNVDYSANNSNESEDNLFNLTNESENTGWRIEELNQTNSSDE